jgi:predicted alpha/beta hydrolase family esterase
MRNVIFAHGKPPRERYEDPAIPKPHLAHWFPWAEEQLTLRGIDAEVPALPKPYHPVFADWKSAFPGHNIDAATGLVGFSAGSDFLLRLLSEDTHITAEHLVLVAPWRDSAEKYGDFSKYTLDSEICERVGRLTIVSSLDDSNAIQSNASRLADILPSADHLKLNGYGHFMIGNNMTSEDFPELMTILLGQQ